MKKRLLVLFIAMLGMALQSVAQKVDLQSLRFVEVTSDGVNMRKAPSTSSAKLMAERLAGAEGCESLASSVWSDSPRSKGYTRESNSLNKGVILPVVAETSDWYKALYWDWTAGTFEVYVSKQFCREVRKVNITRPEGTVVTSGTYKGWYVVDNSDPENGDEYIMGHLVNGFMVYEMSCTENCSDVYQLLDNKSFSQLSRYFKKREKKLVNYMINPDDGTRSFEMD